MTPDDIKRLRALCEQATPADKWKAETTWNNGGMPLADFTLPGSINGATVEMLAADAHFAVAARAALPQLLDECEALRRERDEMIGMSNAGDAKRGYGLMWCPHCREILRGVGVWRIADGTLRCSRHLDQPPLAPVTDEIAVAAYRKGCIDHYVAERHVSEMRALTTSRDHLSARVAELERLLGEACGEFESAAASFADQGWPALSSEMRTRASRWRREGGIE